jgi:hypothetical protein
MASGDGTSRLIRGWPNDGLSTQAHIGKITEWAPGDTASVPAHQWADAAKARMQREQLIESALWKPRGAR